MNIIIIGKFVFDSSPNNIGDDVDAIVPNADEKPIPNPLNCEGNS